MNERAEDWRELGEAPARARAIGIDAGSTLIKVCVESTDAAVYESRWPAADSERAVSLIRHMKPDCVGLTGCGASAIAGATRDDVAAPVLQVVEFEAWRAGADALLQGMGRSTDAPYMLVSVGTGTSILRVDRDGVTRAGGTSLGGGTALGLGYAMTGCRSHAELIELAARGDRSGVDLLISDIFPETQGPLAAQATASSFGKLARASETIVATPSNASGSGSVPCGPRAAQPEDLAAAIMGLVAESVGFLTIAHARLTEVQTVVYGGSTLESNPALVQIMQGMTAVFGFDTVVLEKGGHAGAFGAMRLAKKALRET